MNNREIRHENKLALRELEDVYVNGKLDNLDEIVNKKKEELVNALEEYNNKFSTIEYDKNDLPHKIINLNPIIIQNYFFKSLSGFTNKEPKYNAEKLGIVFTLYQDIVAQINAEIGTFTPTLTSFCNFIGLTLSTFRNSCGNSDDPDMKVVFEKINDYCFDANISLAQRGKLSEKSTIYRMKSEQERGEKSTPEIHIHTKTEALDMESALSRLKELSKLNNINAESSEVIDKDGK